MKSDLISIIVPAYNVEKYVKKTIESILSQTYNSIEVICIDDGSKDNTLSALKSIAEKDSRVKVFSKDNEGVTKARKYGVEKANGEYIGFVDADDEIEPTMYERLYINLNKFNADISHCGHEVFYLDGRREYYYNTGRLEQQDTISGIQSLISGSFEPGLCNKLYHNTLLHSFFQSGLMDYSIKINEDLLMNYYLFKTAKSSVYEDVCLYRYLKREGSASSSKLNDYLIWDQIRVKRIIMEDAMGTDFEENAHKAYLLTCIHVYNSIIEYSNTEFITDQKKVWKIICDNKESVQLLNKKYRLLAKMIISTPNIYRILYKVLS